MLVDIGTFPQRLDSTNRLGGLVIIQPRIVVLRAMNVKYHRFGNSPYTCLLLHSCTRDTASGSHSGIYGTNMENPAGAYGTVGSPTWCYHYYYTDYTTREYKAGGANLGYGATDYSDGNYPTWPGVFACQERDHPAYSSERQYGHGSQHISRIIELVDLRL